MKNSALFLIFLLSSATLAQPDIASFTNYPEFEDIKISPKGTYLAFTQKDGAQEYLVVVRANDLSGVSKTSFGVDADIQSFEWANDERILLSPGRSFMGLIDYKAPTGEIFGINANGRSFEILFGYQAGLQQTGSRIKSREGMSAGGRIVDMLPDDPNRVIVQSIKGVEEFNRAWTMDVRSGQLKGLVKAPIPNGNFITDANHEIRFCVGANKKNIGELYLLNADKKWELLVTEEDKERWVVPIVPYGKDGKMLVRDESSSGISGFSIWDPKTGEKQELFHHPVVDVSTLYYDNEPQLWAFSFIDHFPSYFYPDESHPFVALHKKLQASFKDHHVQILDETDDRSKVIVYISGPQYPGDYLLMDTQTQSFLMRLPRYPNLATDALARVDPVEFTVRDGETIRGYITLPANRTEKNLPMVVLPHGGPHGIYDTWTYDYETQLLASRGYAVLQVNYRGSGGRGTPFLEAGFGEWGGKMQDDITDATRWAIKDGIADPERICIYGGSYGAYAALTGAFKEPDLYKCAIGMSGVYDLNLMFEAGDIPDSQRGLSYLKKALGDDKALLASRSPVANADKIKANVMLIHGNQDVRAPIEHAERLRAALKKHGKEVVWITERGENHGIFSEENRVKIYTELLAFLEQNIGK